MAHRPAKRLGASLLTIALLSFAAAASADQDQACLKQVFGRYCLGGAFDALMQGMPQPLARQRVGESLAAIFSEGPDRLYLLGFRNRLYKVVRAYATSTQLRYDETYGLLRDKYGPGEDPSRFPDYATTATMRLASIRRGEGRALHVWRPSTEWRIELSWTREIGLSLAYVASALEAEREAQVDNGL